jgi:hypothetical protein
MHGRRLALHEKQTTARRTAATLTGVDAARQSGVEVFPVQLLLRRRKRRSDIDRFHGNARRYR